MAGARKVAVTKYQFWHARSPRERILEIHYKVRLLQQKEGCGAYSPAHGHMATPMTPKWGFPYNFIMIESPITKKVGVRIFPETFAVIFPVNER